MKCYKLFAAGEHRWLAFTQDDHRPGSVVDTTQVVITAGRSTMLLDPGGLEIFPAMMGALVHEVDMETVGHIFLSHQDPDVGSALSLWRQVTPPGTLIHISALWPSYVSHFDAEARFVPIPDEGGEMSLGGITLRFLPSHYMHSPGAFSVYDPAARALFSGDVGAAILPGGSGREVWVTDFADHVPFMAGFHRRVLSSREARDAWVEMVARLPLDFMVPQHGLAFRGPDIQRFLDWLSKLDIGCGVDAYRGRAARG
ncbi:MAG: MBL fold metallo-hydrolase [Rhodospirillaceae bacterium]